MRLFLISAVLLISGCSSSTDQIATKNGFKHQPVQTSKFNLTSYQKIAYVAPATEISAQNRNEKLHELNEKSHASNSKSHALNDKSKTTVVPDKHKVLPGGNSAEIPGTSVKHAEIPALAALGRDDKNVATGKSPQTDKHVRTYKSSGTDKTAGANNSIDQHNIPNRETIAKNWEEKVVNAEHDVQFKRNTLNDNSLVQVETEVNIYIEGDGRITRNRYQVSNDPSPRKATVMQLAALDPSPNVVYLARPCQYSPHDLQTVCQKRHWTSARYSEEIVQALDQAIDQIKQQAGATQINLIGFSGGGALAVLIAASRTDVASIRTVAGNLDLQTMQSHHHSRPLSESLDPMTVAEQVQHIPQIHFVGNKDNIVPIVVSENFCKCAKLKPSQVQVLKGVSHHDGWAEQWPQLIAFAPPTHD